MLRFIVTLRVIGSIYEVALKNSCQKLRHDVVAHDE